MNKQLKLVHEFHKKFGVGINSKPDLISEEVSLNRYKMMREEVEEYLDGTQHKDLQNIAKELCDILYTTYGTILEHGLQDKIDDIFDEVHRSNMSKECHPVKVKKGEDYFEANIKKFFE